MRASRRTGAFLLLSIAACAARVNQPASAQSAPKEKIARATPIRAPQAIGAATVDRVSKVWEVAAGGRARAVAIDRKLASVAYSGASSVLLFDLTTGKRAGSIAACDSVLRGGLGYHDGKLFVVCAQGVELFQAGKPISLPFEVAKSPITASALVGSHLALAHDDGVIRIHRVDGAPHVEIVVPGPPIAVKSLALTRDGKRIAVAWVQGSIWWWDTGEPDKPHPLVRHPSESDSSAFSEDGQLFVEEGEPSFTTLWSFAGAPSSRTRLRNGSWVKRLLFTRDGRWLVRGGSDGLELAEIDGPKRVALDTRGSVEDAALDETGAFLAAADRDGRLSLWAVR